MPEVRRAARTAARLARSRVVQAGAVLVAVSVAGWNLNRAPHASLLPMLVGVAPWLVGKYVLCPLRWHAFSASGKRQGWHLRVYAESELLGLLTPGHAGADVWRVRRLELCGVRRPDAIAEVGFDRLVGGLGLAAFVAVTGASLPLNLLAAAVGIALLAFAGGALVARRRPDLVPQRPLPPPRALVRGLLISMVYQLCVLALLLGSVHAVGSNVDPFALLGVFGAAQVAGVLPGMAGASPREGALVVGLATLGLPWAAAFGAVALVSVVAWGPALVLGGGSLLLRRLAPPAHPAVA